MYNSIPPWLLLRVSALDEQPSTLQNSGPHDFR